LSQAVPDNQKLLLAFIWLTDEHRPTAEVEKRVVSLMKRIGEKML
jgi:ribonuclease P protein component